MKHYGDVTQINGATVEPVDVITFGSPCQDMSIAGKRAGIQDGTRSNLFFEAVRIIKEMRIATNGKYPRYAVWENVPGAFSSNKGRDFHAVLEALCSVCDSSVSIPEPVGKDDKLQWRAAGEIVGNNYSVAWRTLDAQYWGVPQRRKRIYLVADFTSQRAGEILFKPDSLRGDMPQGDEAGEGVTADAVGGVDGSAGFIGKASTGAGSVGFEIGCAATLRAGQETHCVIALQGNGIDRSDNAGCNGCGWRDGAMYTLNTIDRPAVCYDARNHVAQDISGTIQAKSEGGHSLNYINPVCYDARGNGDGEIVNTLTGDHQDRITDYTSVVIHHAKLPRKYIIRRLTPTECARLQGFPDAWGELAPYNPADADFWESVRKTHARINGKAYKPTKNLKRWYDKLHTDSAEYKAYGNGLALPCAEYVIHNIAEQGIKTLGSLFDGIGGFPLAGAMNGIAPLWASEVEPYPIAVTLSRFGGNAAERESNL